MRNKNNKGIVEILTVLLLVIFVLFAIGAVFMVLQPVDKKNTSSTESEIQLSPVSSSTDIDILEQELEETNIGSFDDDLRDMEFDASTL